MDQVSFLDGGRGGTAEKLYWPTIASPQPGGMLAFATFHGFVWEMSGQTYQGNLTTIKWPVPSRDRAPSDSALADCVSGPPCNAYETRSCHCSVFPSFPSIPCMRTTVLNRASLTRQAFLGQIRVYTRKEIEDFLTAMNFRVRGVIYRGKVHIGRLARFANSAALLCPGFRP
ncbi:MAG: hypothetical protein QOJ15_56 [Bradyrhizobium sp.]|nr:hypothetical protein [Bradyrhizobium sp.]